VFRKPDFQKAFESVFRSRIKWSISKRKHHPKVKGTTLRHSRVLRGIERIANCSGRCERETAAVFEFDRTPSCRGRVSVMVFNFFPSLDACLQQGGDGGMKHHSAVGSWVTAHALA